MLKTKSSKSSLTKKAAKGGKKPVSPMVAKKKAMPKKAM